MFKDRGWQFEDHNMSGNQGRPPSWSGGVEEHKSLLEVSLNDPLWSLEGLERPVIQGGRCPHCKNWVGEKNLENGVQMQHVLNGCKTFATQSRYRWRHQAVLDYIGSCMEAGPQEDLRCYLDVPGRRTHDEGTVPDQLIVTNDRPDIFILDQRDHLLKPELIIIDLTIPWDDRVDAARSEKKAKFSRLVSAIAAKDFSVTYHSMEIGSYKQRTTDSTEAAIKVIYTYTSQQIPYNVFKANIVQLTSLCSYKIFASRQDPVWKLNCTNLDTLQFPYPPKFQQLAKETTTILHHDDHDDNDEDCELDEGLGEDQENQGGVHEIHSTPTKKVTNCESQQQQQQQQSKSNVKKGLREYFDWELLVILIIFCSILYILSVIWNNLLTSSVVGIIALPILKLLGKI